MKAQQSPRSLRRARRSEAGASFIELMLSVVVISTSIVASTNSMGRSSEVYDYFANGKHEALMLAQEIHEAALLLPWELTAEEIAANPDGNFGPDVQVLWDLDAMAYTPPRSASYDVVISHIGWSQHVTVRVVDLNHPEIEVDPLTFDGETLTELKVVIKQQGFKVDEVSWWMTPPTGA